MADPPPTIHEKLKAAYDIDIFYFPFTNLIVSDAYKDIAEGLRLCPTIGWKPVIKMDIFLSKPIFRSRRCLKCAPTANAATETCLLPAEKPSYARLNAPSAPNALQTF